jgi:hypothetical protein
MKPEKWVELQLAKAYDALERNGLVAVVTDSRFHLAVITLALACVIWKIVTSSRAKRLAEEAERRERAAKEEARQREKLEKVQKKRRRHVVSGVLKDAVVVADFATAANNKSRSVKVDEKEESEKKQQQNKKKEKAAVRQPYMARLARAALGASTDTNDEWDYEREWEDEQLWRREAASADRTLEWTTSQTAALTGAIRKIKADAHPTREGRFRAIAEEVACGKDWMRCAAMFVDMRDAALERRRVLEREARQTTQAVPGGKKAALKSMSKTSAVAAGGGGGEGGGSLAGWDVEGMFGFSGKVREGGGGGGGGGEDDDEYDDHKDVDEDDEDVDVEEEEEDDEDLMPLDLTPKHSGTLIALDGVQATGVTALRPHALALTLQCGRCNARQDVTLSGWGGAI